MARFSKGDFVKQKTTSGTLIGGLLMVDEQFHGQVAGHHIPENGIGSFIKSPHLLEKIQHITLYISPNDVDELRKSERFTFKKVGAGILWEKALKENSFKIAVLINRAKNAKIILENPEFFDPYVSVKFFKPKEKTIAVAFSKKILL